MDKPFIATSELPEHEYLLVETLCGFMEELKKHQVTHISISSGNLAIVQVPTAPANGDQKALSISYNPKEEVYEIGIIDRA